jgi:hypothetical protein
VKSRAVFEHLYRLHKDGVDAITPDCLEATDLLILNSMKGYDAEGQLGPRKPLPDFVHISDPPIDKVVSEPSSEQRDPVVVPVTAPVATQEPAYPQEALRRGGLD